MARPNFIPADLREQLRKDSEKAEKNGDTRCAKTLRELSEDSGWDAPPKARELGLPACESKYPSAREVMRLIRMVEAVEGSGR